MSKTCQLSHQNPVIVGHLAFSTHSIKSCMSHVFLLHLCWYVVHISLRLPLVEINFPVKSIYLCETYIKLLTVHLLVIKLMLEKLQLNFLGMPIKALSQKCSDPGQNCIKCALRFLLTKCYDIIHFHRSNQEYFVIHHNHITVWYIFQSINWKDIRPAVIVIHRSLSIDLCLQEGDFRCN